ncbi:cytochrome P450 [Cyathus striatus]|nr:cytochrome P450 [Cyathus striatus]
MRLLLFIFSAFCAGFIAILVHRWYRFTTSRLKELPGPPVPSFALGNAGELERSPMGTRMNLWSREYGLTYKIRGPFFEPWLILGDPRGINHVLMGKNYVRPESDSFILELFFGRSLFSVEGEEHRKMRKYLNPAFTLNSVQEISHIFFDLAYELKRRWEDALENSHTGILDIASGIHMLGMDAISTTMFMHNLSASEGKIPNLLHKINNSPSGSAFHIIMKRVASIFPYIVYLPSPIKSYADNLRHEFGAIAEEMWTGKDIVGMHAKLLDALGTFDQGNKGPISKEEAIAQIIGVLFAGSETSANVISECLYELALQTDIQEKLRRELVKFNAEKGHFPGFEDFMSATALPYLDGVVRETLRTKAVLREINRIAAHDDVIPLEFPIETNGQRNVYVKAGQVIQIPIRDGINVDERIWGADASQFRPERWIERDGVHSAAELIRTKGHILTFGEGTKACLGRTFALAEIKIVLSILIYNFSFERSSEVLDFYLLGGGTVKPMVKGRENEGVQVPLKVKLL